MRWFAFWATFTAATLLVVFHLHSCTTREEERFALVDNTLDDCVLSEATGARPRSRDMSADALCFQKYTLREILFPRGGGASDSLERLERDLLRLVRDLLRVSCVTLLGPCRDAKKRGRRRRTTRGPRRVRRAAASLPSSSASPTRLVARETKRRLASRSCLLSTEY
jgi:hypothetical protein